MKSKILIFNVLIATLSLLTCLTQALPQSEQNTSLSPGNKNNQCSNAITKPWWSNRTAGFLGGIAGSIFGILGGLIGSLAGMCKAPKIVKTTMAVLFFGGLVSLTAGLIALLSSQPYAVYYPLLILGFISTVLMGALYPIVRNRYLQDELRKMQAADASGS